MTDNNEPIEPLVKITFKRRPGDDIGRHLTKFGEQTPGQLIGHIDLRELMLYGLSWPHEDVREVRIDRAYVAGAITGCYKRGWSHIYVGEDKTVTLIAPSIRTFVRTWARVVNRQFNWLRPHPR